MRKVLLVIVLVGAAFSGGAVVNGPGLRWVQSMVVDRMGIGGNKAPEVVVAGGELAGPAPIHEDVPSAPIPPLNLEPIPTKPKPPTPIPASETSESVAGTTLPLLSPVPSGGASEAAPRPLEPLSTSKDRERDAMVLAASAIETQPPTPAPVHDKEPAAVPDDWAAVRRELKALGVSRYGTEGDPSGKVRFHCVIPLAGRRAVGQHFEAEGDDELQAARAAIKRIALWRATEAEGAY